jgi:hypothetical protein
MWSRIAWISRPSTNALHVDSVEDRLHIDLVDDLLDVDLLDDDVDVDRADDDWCDLVCDRLQDRIRVVEERAEQARPRGDEAIMRRLSRAMCRGAPLERPHHALDE